MHLEVVIVGEPERFEVERRPADCVCTRIEVHDEEHDVVIAAGQDDALAPAEDHVVLDALEPQRVIVLQRGCARRIAVHPADQVAQAVGAFEVPVPDLVLLRVEVFLAARLAGGALLQLEHRSVDPVVRAEPGGEQEAR